MEGDKSNAYSNCVLFQLYKVTNKRAYLLAVDRLRTFREDAIPKRLISDLDFIIFPIRLQALLERAR